MKSLSWSYGQREDRVMSDLIEWRPFAACRGLDPTLFFADHNDNQAIHICHQCPVMAPCRYWALEYPDDQQHGTAGGLSATQRRNIRHQWTRIDTTVMRYRRREALDQSRALRREAVAA